MLVDATLSIEKVRVRTQVRQSHLHLQGRFDIETDELLMQLRKLEEYTDGRIATIMKSHPAYDWFSKVKGIGKENIGKVVGLVRVKPEQRVDGAELPYADTISALWKFAGFSVEDGKAPKRVKGGGTLTYNSQLRSMCWRLGSSLLRAKGKFYDYYIAEKDKYYQRYENQGMRIVPATELPKNNGKRYESQNMISEGHVHNQALRKMIKLFLACLWLTWREAEGLPVTKPYAIDQLGHNSMIDPWSMIDR
ncbi:hypothetical protein ES703_18795 [subsurface metagenome]